MSEDILWEDVTILPLSRPQAEAKCEELRRGFIDGEYYNTRLLGPTYDKCREALSEIFGPPTGGVWGIDIRPNEGEKEITLAAHGAYGCKVGDTVRVWLGSEWGMVGTASEVVFIAYGVMEQRPIRLPGLTPYILHAYVATEITLTDVEDYDGCEYDLRR